MAKELSEHERSSLQDLREHFQEHVERYRETKERELAQGGRGKLQEELGNLEDYLEGCRRSEIDDVRINIEFCGAKVVVLREVLRE